MVKSNNQGFTLIELMIVVAIIAIIAAIAVPNLLSARLAANESNAIATLRQLVSSQAQFQQGGSIDADADGTGEYGFFGDLSGFYQLDSHGGPVNANFLNPPVLSASFRNINAAGEVTKSGYIFQIYVATAAGSGVETGVPAAGTGHVVADADAAELTWCAYAWPGDFGNTGNRAFFVNQAGEIMFTNQAVGQAYDGAGNGPAAEDAFIAGTAAGVITANTTPGVAAAGLEVWVTL
ncbi:MAG: prepilin-type N-terminal cleavage/methylation domain-containing protein [Planctomycetota bacterium]|jgi:prepilin-type N-terminal cleavage/methylation domain-containing protein